MHAGPARRTEQKGSRNPSRPLFCALPDAGPSVGMLPVSYKSQTPLHAHQGVQRGLVMRSAFVLRLMPKTISLPFSCLTRLSLDALRVLCPTFSFASPLAVCAVSVPPPFMSALAGLLRAADQPVHGDVKRPGEGKRLLLRQGRLMHRAAQPDTLPAQIALNQKHAFSHAVTLQAPPKQAEPNWLPFSGSL